MSVPRQHAGDCSLAVPESHTLLPSWDQQPRQGRSSAMEPSLSLSVDTQDDPLQPDAFLEASSGGPVADSHSRYQQQPCLGKQRLLLTATEISSPALNSLGERLAALPTSACHAQPVRQDSSRRSPLQP